MSRHCHCLLCEDPRGRTFRRRRQEPLPFSLDELDSSDDYVFRIRSAAMFDDEDFHGWWDYVNPSGTLHAPLPIPREPAQ